MLCVLKICLQSVIFQIVSTDALLKPKYEIISATVADFRRLLNAILWQCYAFHAKLSIQISK